MQKAAAAEYRSSGLPDAAQQEEQEATFLESLLPKQLSPEEIRDAVEGAYGRAKEDGSILLGRTDIQSTLKLLFERVEADKGSGAVTRGDIARIVMPLLQKEGFVKGGKKRE